jgi:hypothetical protein
MFVRILYVWLNHKKIEVPVSFEEVCINGKGDDEEDIISELDKLIIKIFEEVDDIQKKQDCILEKNESNREVVPLFDASADDRKDRNDINYNKTKKVIPIFGELIVVSKRIVKLGELTLAENKGTENKKLVLIP